jgi:hypothetical protein
LCKTCNNSLFLYNSTGIKSIPGALPFLAFDCSILNNRLVTWLDTRDIIHDEQNGFRKSKSTIDHLSTLTSIIFINISNNTGDKTQLCFKPEFTLSHSVIFPFSLVAHST